MKLLFIIVAFAAGSSARVTQYEVLPYDSVADAAAVIVHGNARFTVLTSRLIRMEFASTGHFEDRGTLAMLNRKLAVPHFQKSSDAGTLTITTDHATLKYSGGAFSASSLSVSGSFGKWSHGDRNDGNLLGTIKSLDELGPISLNCTENAGTKVHGESLHCEWGIISRSGWAIYDDSENYCLGADDWWDGDAAASHNSDDVDLYGFFHGVDYKEALADLTSVGGKAAMVPRAASGIWWTRWFDFNEYDALQVVEAYRSRSIPLDIFVLDMDWHRKNSWTGYSYDNSLFPDEAAFMATIHDEGLLLAANLHDDVGIGAWENKYEYMAKLMGIDPASGTTVPFTACANTTYAYALEDVVLGSLESQRVGGALADGGMDFWWIDWQQGGDHGGCVGQKQNPTIWTNKIRCTDAKRRATVRSRGAAEPRGRAAHDQRSAAAVGRNMVLGRWGGMGSHRYQVGFSGDVKGLSWENLAYQPFFTLTASNVGYGSWSHDIEGPAGDFEMYTRWVQWAAFSPIFRSHERGMSGGSCADVAEPAKWRSSCAIIEPWNVPSQYFEANRAAMRRRAQLVPYIYSASRVAFDSGLSLLRPMYYEHPTLDQAYAADPQGNFSQYYFGDDMVVAPVVKQSVQGSGATNWSTGMTTTTIWLPPGTWFEETTSVLHTVGAAGALLSKAYDLSETPVFVRGGALLPSIPLADGDTLGTAARDYSSLVFDLYPGADSGSARVYEDDGFSTAYTLGDFSWLTATYSKSGQNLTFSVHPASAPSSATPPRRKVTLRLRSVYPPTKVTVNGQPVTFQRASRGARAVQSAQSTWHYCGVEMAVVVQLPEMPTSSDLEVVVEAGDWVAQAKALDGVKGGVMHAILAKAASDATRHTVGAQIPAADKLKKLSSFGSALKHVAEKAPANFSAKLSTYASLFKDAVAETHGMDAGKNPARKAYALALLSSIVTA